MSDKVNGLLPRLRSLLHLVSMVSLFRYLALDIWKTPAKDLVLVLPIQINMIAGLDEKSPDLRS